MNVGSIPSVEVFNYALGASDQKVSIEFDGADFSRFMARVEGADWCGPLTRTDCQMKHAGEVMKNLGVTSADLIKIDCEGAEYDVLTALPEEMQQDCNCYVG